MSIEKLNEITEAQWNSVNPKNKKIVEEFIRESIQLSDQTLRQYTSALKIYFYWIKENCENKDFNEIKPRDFLLYQNYLSRRDLSSSAIRLKRAAVSSLNSYIETYFEHLNFRNYITKKITAPVHAFVNEKNPPTLDEYRMICDELEKREMWQHLAYLKFSFTTGCRRGEAIQLTKDIISQEKQIKKIKIKDEDGKDIERQVSYYVTGKIRCKGRGKEGKVRTFRFDEEAMTAIKKWLEIRGEDNCPYVFVSHRKGEVSKINPATLNLWSSTTFTNILGRRFHPHIIREGRATSLVIEQGRDINVVKELLGHNSIQTSEIYVIRQDNEMSDEAFLD